MLVAAQAQVTYVKTLGTNGGDFLNSAIQTNDGNVLVIGSTSLTATGDFRGYVSKINGSAKVIWDMTIELADGVNLINGIQLQNNDYLLAGWVYDIAQGGTNALLVRMDQFGNLIWSNSFGGDLVETAFDVMETSDGHFVVAGQSDSDSGVNADVLLIKVDQDGNEVWTKTYGGDGEDGFDGKGLIEDDQGNYVLSARWSSSVPEVNGEGLFMAVNPDGDIVRIVSYTSDNSTKYESFNGLLEKTASGFRTFGTSIDFNILEENLWMTELAENGTVIWTKSYGLHGEYLKLRDVRRMPNGHYILAGTHQSDNIALERFGFLIELNEDGEIIWSKSYGDPGFSDMNAVIPVQDGFLALGHTTTHGLGGSEMFAVRVDQFGTISGCSSEIQLTTLDLNLIQNIPANIEIETLDWGRQEMVEINNVALEETLVCDGCSANDLVAGLLCENAPIICSIDCLDGFTGTLPDEFIDPQPEPLCGGNGFPNNMSWFAFVAGSNSIDLSIIPSNCTTIYNDDGTIAQTIGIQAGIFEDCSFENSIVCETDGCMDLVAETLNLSSDQFVEGQTYYLFVDGCGGSVCDYEVVVNSAQQAFEMDEITTISNSLNVDLDTDTICMGSELTLTLDDFDQSVNFSWSIDPPTSEFPSGVHPSIDTNSVTFQFNEEGCFDIHVYAYNDCDNSETRTVSVCVAPLENEIFSDIYVCQECFPITLISPKSGCIITEGGGAPTVLTEDPNGDGVPGWLGTSTINGPGLDSNMVTNNLGCSYWQYVNVVEIPLSPREQVDHYFCLDEFPVDINGTIFSLPGDTRNVTIEGGAASGCDSLQSITAHAIDFLGSAVIGNCESGQVELAMEVSNVPMNAYDSVTYIWYDDNGDVATDSDGIDSILTVMGVGSFSVQISVTLDGKTCPQTFGPYMIDVDNLAPDIPNITYSPIMICASESTAQIYLANQGLAETYQWSFTPDLPFTLGLTSDTVYVDISNGLDFEFCVFGENGCGSSSSFCDNVMVVQSPDSDFAVDDEICLDSVSIIEYTGSFAITSNTSFEWDFDGGTAQNTADIDGPGPFEVGFPSAGIYTVSLTLSESGCNSLLTQHTVEVVEAFVPPMIACESGAGSVTFTWDDSAIDDLSIDILSGQTAFVSNPGSYIVEGLGSEEEVIIQMTFSPGHACGPTIITENCLALPCPDIGLEILSPSQNYCLGEAVDIQLAVAITGDDTGVGVWSGDFVSSDAIFDVETAGVGQHSISYSYSLNDCVFVEDTIINIHPTPMIDTSITIALCEEMGSNMVDIFTDPLNSVFLDGIQLSEWLGVEVEAGMHMIEVMSPAGCSSTLEFEVEDLGVEDLLVVGPVSIISGNSAQYNATYSSTLNDLILMWTLDGDTICVDCEQVEIAPQEEAELCVRIEYGDGCNLEDCIMIEVNKETELFIPNAFSPNDDNVNDHFIIKSNNATVVIEEAMIFDRWGERVYHQSSFNPGEESNSWDGTKNGHRCEPGVYVYIITFLDEEGGRKQIAGDITLVR